MLELLDTQAEGSSQEEIVRDPNCPSYQFPMIRHRGAEIQRKPATWLDPTDSEKDRAPEHGRTFHRPHHILFRIPMIPHRDAEIQRTAAGWLKPTEHRSLPQRAQRSQRTARDIVTATATARRSPLMFQSCLAADGAVGLFPTEVGTPSAAVVAVSPFLLTTNYCLAPFDEAQDLRQRGAEPSEAFGRLHIHEND